MGFSMSESQTQKQHRSEEIDLRELLQVLWGGRILITIFAGLAAAMSVLVALSLPNIYTSTDPRSKLEGGTGGLSRLASQYGGLASLAGINLGGLEGDGMSRPAFAVEKMKSYSF